MKTTAHQAKYFAHEIVCFSNNHDAGDLTGALMSAQVHLHPHQIEAALFALKHPLHEGVMLADEVGLGKTIEAGLALCQLWAERKRRLLVVCPASLRKQWQEELHEKFALPGRIAESSLPPFADGVLIMSYEFARKYAEQLQAADWDCVVLDEAHKLRNAYKDSNKIGQALRIAFAGKKKLLLTATPLQNSLMELYGLSLFLDPYLFGDAKLFRRDFIAQPNSDALRLRLHGFVQRTLRRDVSEYVSFTQRHALTQQFTPRDDEFALYQNVSAFLQRENAYALPRRQRHLTGMILRKLLASSPFAVLGTLEVMRSRLLALQQGAQENTLPVLFPDEDVYDSAEEWEEAEAPPESPDAKRLAEEIALLDSFIAQAQRLCNGTDSKAQALLEALQTGFARMAALKAKQKAIIFTESTRTQQHLAAFLQENGYKGQVVLFNGTNNDAAARAIYEAWQADPANRNRITGAVSADKRAALIDRFRHDAQIMIATEAAAEGVNLQFCSLLINYDLPWNPQRVEQRIGRCHRYGQESDVVVMNFLNSRNEADRRILELLTEKFQLFSGLFGASNDILGRVENADLDFEKRVAQIFDNCRTPQEIDRAFDQLQAELEEAISARMAQTEATMHDALDQDVIERLNLSRAEIDQRLDKASRWFWRLSQFVLRPYVEGFDEEKRRFQLRQSPLATAPTGSYCLTAAAQDFPFRPNTALGEWCLEQALELAVPPVSIVFRYNERDGKISDIARHQGQSGWLRLDKLTAKSRAATAEALVFTACNDAGDTLDADFCRHLLSLSGEDAGGAVAVPALLAECAAANIETETLRQKGISDAEMVEASQRLTQWAEDQTRGLEHELDEAKREEKQEKRRHATLTDATELLAAEETLQRLRQRIRKLRSQIDEREEEIEAKRDHLIGEMRARIAQQTNSENLLVLRWRIA
ncbi:SNF2-related protein [Cardiobacterium hominis]|uniref:SNF2-related protein n=1 Tax=Cardiobacterium hominis TaxID=2718 RepID=UPI0028D22A26|nr:SNF2-related protein [Cardiobacterium hominis]